MNKKKDFYDQIEKRISQFDDKPQIEEFGSIVEVGDGIAKIDQLSSAVLGEILLFPNSVRGLVLNLERNEIGAIILGDYTDLKEGDKVKPTGEVLKTPVGEDLLGRVLNPLGDPLDEKGKVKFSDRMPYERIAPGVVKRQPVDTPLQTGIIAIDSIIPIGRGQRELIVGDRETGKTAIALDTIINQKDPDVISIYVGIGQKTSKIVRLADTLKKHQAMDNTIIVAANASDSASMQYLAPYAACTMGEYFMNQGKDVLIAYDDLTKHAWAYRQISLLLKRPSGREAYPGDIFYLHSRLLERACKLSDAEGGGSMTALPIIETQEGNVSAYVPTNVISITDGQIYLEKDLFNAGIRPAINVGLSVSRVGGEAQIKAMKQVAGDLKLELSQYRELEAFAQFGSELDERTRERLEKGEKLTELLKQPQFQPLPVEEQVILIWGAINGYLQNINTQEVEEFKPEFLEYIRDNHPNLIVDIKEHKRITSETEEKLQKATKTFLASSKFGKKEEPEQTEESEISKLAKKGESKWRHLEKSKEK